MEKRFRVTLEVVAPDGKRLLKTSWLPKSLSLEMQHLLHYYTYRVSSIFRDAESDQDITKGFLVLLANITAKFKQKGHDSCVS